MQRDLPKAAALLPAQLSFDAIGYCCTSGATMIGEDNVMEVLWLAMNCVPLLQETGIRSILQ